MKSVVLVINFIVCTSFYGSAMHIEPFRCQKNIYRVNDCNLCSCTQKDLPQLICTRMGCDYEDAYVNCVIGTSWYEGCNKCWCAKDIGTMCTTYKCRP